MRLYCCTVDVVSRPLLQPHPIRYPEFRDELLKLFAEDQALRASDVFQSSDRNVIRDLTLQEHKRADRVLGILKVIKSPSAHNIGLDGSRAVWLIALHNPDYKHIADTVLHKMQYIYRKNREQVFYPGIPYLVDRRMVFTNTFDHKKKQLYGTQRWASTASDGSRTQGAFPIIDGKNLAARRHKFGLAGPGDKIKCIHRI